MQKFGLQKEEIKVYEKLVENNYLTLNEHDTKESDIARKLFEEGLINKKLNKIYLKPADKLFEILLKRIYPDKKMTTEFKFRSKYQQIVLKRFADEIFLFLNNSPQVCSLDEEEFHEYIATLPALLAKNLRRVVILGGGDGLALRNILKFKEVKKVILVEIDKDMIKLAKYNSLMQKLNNNSFSDRRVELVIGDAFKWLINSDLKFDVIINDCEETFTDQPEGIEQVYGDFYKSMFDKLTDGGIATFNSSNDEEEMEVFNEFLKKHLKYILPENIINKINSKQKLYEKDFIVQKHFFKNIKIACVNSAFVGNHTNFYISNQPIEKQRDAPRTTKFIKFSKLKDNID